MRHKLTIHFLALCSFLVFGHLVSGDPAAVFKKMAGLAGNWKGTYQWSGGRSDSGAVQVNYFLTGNGTSLVENYSYGKDPMMTSVYHMDAGTLRMTHFCAGNQPRLKAVSFDNDEQVIQFDMVDITNLPEPDAPHVHAVKLALESENKISVTFSVTNHGKESREEIHLERVSDSNT